jgi:hypothetical protein
MRERHERSHRKLPQKEIPLFGPIVFLCRKGKTPFAFKRRDVGVK